jgi:hypothetical protein
VVWLPRTAVGEGDGRGGDGDDVAATLLDGVAGAEGDPDCVVPDDACDVPTVDGEEGAVADGAGLRMTVGEEADALAEGVELAWFAAGRSATLPVDDAAKTTAPSATRPARTAIGTTPTRLPRGRRSRQLGQKPETGVVT